MTECSKFKEMCWLENEISQSEKTELYKHLAECNNCKEEYELKLLTDEKFSEYCGNIKSEDFYLETSRRTIPFRKLSIVAASIIVTFTVLTFSCNNTVASFISDKLNGFFSQITQNFGSEYTQSKDMVQSGGKITEDNIEIDVKSISISKTNFSLLFGIRDIENEFNICEPINYFIRVNGQTYYNINGFIRKDTENKVVWGNLSFDMPLDELPKEMIFNVEKIQLTKNGFNDLSKLEGDLLVGNWEVPIKIDSDILERADKDFKRYSINEKYKDDVVDIDFQELYLETSKSTLNYTMNSSKDIKLGDVEILSDSGEVLANRVYDNGQIRYFDQKGYEQKGMVSENYSQIVLCPILNDIKPGKIKIESYLAFENPKTLELSIDQLLENSNFIEGIDIKINTISKDSYSFEIETPETTYISLLDNATEISPSEMNASYNLDEENNRVNQKKMFKYNIDKTQNLKLEIKELTEHDINIEVPIE